MKKTQKPKLISYLQTFLDFHKVVKLLLTCLNSVALDATKTIYQPEQSAQELPKFIKSLCDKEL